MIFINIMQRHYAKALSVAVGGGQQQFPVFLRTFDGAKLLSRKPGAHLTCLADLIPSIKKIRAIEGADVEESFWLATTRLALAAPSDNTFTSRPKTLE